jgi:hypothetical protein
MTPEKARSIITQALAEEIYEGPIPEEDEKAIEEAGKLVDLARDAWSQNVRGPEVEAILRIADDKFDGNGTPEVISEPEPEPEEIEEEDIEEDEVDEDGGSPTPWEGYNKELAVDIVKSLNVRSKELSGNDLRDFLQTVWKYESAVDARQTILNHLDKLGSNIKEEAAKADEPEEPEIAEQPSPSPEPEIVEEKTQEEPEVLPAGLEEAHGFQTGLENHQPVGGSNAYHQLLGRIDGELEDDRRHVPEPPADDAPQLPWDWTKSSDIEIQSLYSYYSLLAYHKSFVLTREERVALECKRAADELAGELLKVIDKYDEKGKHKTITLLESEVETDPNVSNWRKLQRKHEAYCASARRERNSLYKLVESLSRFETMRQQEWQRSGQSSYR